MATKFANQMLVNNLRFRWSSELKHLTDAQLVALYDDFAISEYYGNNDENFLKYIKDMEE